MSKKSSKKISAFLFLFLISAFIALFSLLDKYIFINTSKENQSLDIISGEEISIIDGGGLEEKPKDFFSSLGDLKKKEIIKNVVTSKEIKTFCNIEEKDIQKCNAELAKITKKIIFDGSIEDIFIKISAGVDRSGMKGFTEYDSIWFYLNKKSGRLDLNNVEYKKYNELENSEEFYFDFSNIIFDDKDPINLFENINVEKNYLITFVSTLGYGIIDSLEFYYECSEGKKCSIELDE